MEPTVAPYGRACMNCFKAKCKCVSRPGAAGCERCIRIGKECLPSDSIRKRQKNSAAKTAALEEKLDGLVSLLQSVTQSTGSSAALNDALSAARAHQVATDTPTSSSKSGEIETDGFTPVSTQPTMQTNHTASVTDNQTPSSSSSIYDLAPGEIEVRLAMFREQMLPYFPFLHLPDDLTAKELSNDRPFLFQSIIAVTTKETEQRLAQGQEIKEQLARRMVIENQSSIDLLLGLLVFTSWSHDQFLNKTASMSRFAQLAMSLAYELNLNKPWPKDSHMLPTLSVDSNEFSKLFIATSKDLEHRRTVLACFLMSSMVSSYFVQIDSMRWTPYMDECLKVISENEECPTDAAFAIEVRLQLLLHKSSLVTWSGGGPENENPDQSAVPLPFFLKAVQSQFQQLRATVPPEVEQNKLVLASIYYTELSIHEVSLTKSSPAGDPPGFHRLESLCACLNAAKSWFDIFLQFQPREYLGISFSFWIQLVRCIVVLYRLSTFDDPIWDRRLARDTIDVVATLDRIISNMEEVCAMREADYMYVKSARIMKSVRAGCHAALQEQPSNQAVDEPQFLQDPMLWEFSESIMFRDMFGMQPYPT